MNLFDIVKRKDRCLEVIAGAVEAVRYDRPLWYQGVLLASLAHVRLKRADEFIILKTFPRDVGWSLIPRGSESPHVELQIRSSDGSRCATLGTFDTGNPKLITWPSWAGFVTYFDIDVINKRASPVEIKSGTLFDPRAATRDLLQGTGIEVGPGSNPFVKPGPSVDIHYVEALPVNEWLKNYGKHIQTTVQTKEQWSRYIIGDAQKIDCCADASLDFIFSNHVFEHLMNPLGVLENWSRKLKPSGVVVGVVPDLRYCFDLRQPASCPADWLAEYEGHVWALTSQKYEKWCRYTAPYNTPEDLISRNYSIHAHYYTVSGFRQLAEMAIQLDFFSRVFLNTSPNNKDFGWVFWRSAVAQQ